MPTRPPVHRPPGYKSPKQRAHDYERERGSAASRGYGRDWERFRKSILSERPLCQDCEARGLLVEGAEVHHIAKPRDRPDLRLYAPNVRVLCVSCHSIRTGRGE